jgi:flagellar hook protein FlgE
MLRALFSGISGLRAHQQMLDVVSNNISNVNTTGYKSSAALFETTFSQLMKAAAQPQAGLGGTNPAQIGLGVKLAAINTDYGQGASQTTGRQTDMLINGDGFFVVQRGAEKLYTRAGDFSFDADGRLVDNHGALVMGWTAAANGTINNTAPISNIQLPAATLLAPVATTTVTMGGNLSAGATTPIVTSATVYDSQGKPSTLTMTFTNVGGNNWTIDVTDGTTTTTQALSFAANGSTPNPTSMTFNGYTIDLTGISDYAGQTSIAVTNQNGSLMGGLQAFTIGPDGVVTGVFSNGLKQPLAQLALAIFNNPNGLDKAGDSDFRPTANSGIAQLGVPRSGSRGEIQAGSLEMSNVDLAQEFTNLIIAQRGFQANSKVITTGDEVLQDLVNLKR